jgi:nicotinamidase-related amidase
MVTDVEDAMPADALLVIDAQVAVLAGCKRQVETVAVIAELERRARAAKALVLHVQHNAPGSALEHGAPTWAIVPGLTPVAGEMRIDKTACDAFSETPLAEILRDQGVACVAVCGLQTDYCIDTSVRAAVSAGFDVILAADGHTTGDGVLTAEQIIAHHNHVLGRLAHAHRRVWVRPGAEIPFTQRA